MLLFQAISFPACVIIHSYIQKNLRGCNSRFVTENCCVGFEEDWENNHFWKWHGGVLIYHNLQGRRRGGKVCMCVCPFILWSENNERLGTLLFQQRLHLGHFTYRVFPLKASHSFPTSKSVLNLDVWSESTHWPQRNHYPSLMTRPVQSSNRHSCIQNARNTHIYRCKCVHKTWIHWLI